VRRRRCCGRRLDLAAFGNRVQACDQVGVVARRLRLGLLQNGQNTLDRIQRLKNGGNRLGRDPQLAVAELAQNIFRCVSDMLQTRQTQKSAGPLDGMDQTKDITEQFGVVRVLLEPDQFDVKNR
jgi:hypothetical protein